MRNIRKKDFVVTAESDRGQDIIIDRHGRISFYCGKRSYAETSITELTELIATAIKFRDSKTKRNHENY
jgi:hypothetical protein